VAIDDPLYPSERLATARDACAVAGLDALLIPSGSDLRYLTGYPAHVTERLTLLVLPVAAEPVLVVPRLERPDAQVCPAAVAGLRIVDHPDGSDPYPLIGPLLGGARRVGLGNRMWAEQVLALRAALPGTEQRLAGDVLRELRMRKSAAEIAALRAAGAAIDAVHARMGEWLRPGRRWPPTSRWRSGRPGTPPRTSRSSPPDPTGPARTTTPRSG
jgi:Xaa-Pro aminopeptidase